MSRNRGFTLGPGTARYGGQVLRPRVRPIAQPVRSHYSAGAHHGATNHPGSGHVSSDEDPPHTGDCGMDLVVADAAMACAPHRGAVHGTECRQVEVTAAGRSLRAAGEGHGSTELADHLNQRPPERDGFGLRAGYIRVLNPAEHTARVEACCEDPSTGAHGACEVACVGGPPLRRFRWR